MIASDIYVFDKMHWYAMKNYRAKHDKKFNYTIMENVNNIIKTTDSLNNKNR